MRKLVITQNMTVDGRVEMLGDWFDAQGQADTGDLIEENRRQSAAADALLVGRQTFLDLRGYWRDLEDDATGVSAYLNGVDKYVVSSTLDDPEWAGTTVLTGDPLDAVRALKAQAGRDIVLTGSISLAQPLLAAGLVDEVRLFVYPVVQGVGRGLFPEAVRLRPLDATPFRSGVVLLTYAVEYDRGNSSS